MPQDGSTFTYSYSATAPAVQLTEDITIKDTTSKFFASRISDTISGFSTTSVDTLLILPDGDIQLWSWCGCDTVPLPIATHVTHNGTGTPILVKRDSYVGLGSIITKSVYLGQETITAAREAFPCTKVTESDSIPMIFPNHGSLDSTIVHNYTYWYSAKLQYFAKAQEETSYNGGPLTVDWTRILTAYKLGK